MCNGVSNLTTLGCITSPLHADRDELGGTFTIAYDRLGKLHRHCGNGVAKFRILAAGGIGNLVHRGRARGNQHERVVGRGIAVDGDAVEGTLCRVRDGALHQRQADLCIRRHETQHRRHVRSNHGSAFTNACHANGATTDSNIGMGGPAMIEGGGLGVFDPKEIGPVDVQRVNGVIDIVVPDEAAAVAAAKQYLGYFQGPVDEWSCVDQRELRHVIPDDRKRSYDVHQVLQRLFDTGSLLELRRDFGLGMVTALARVEGRPVGVVANNPSHLAGAIDSDGADKAARFLQLCDAFDIPVVTLVDTPGMMVGPEVEKTALVRHCTRLFVTGANITVPMVSIVLRKSYGLGAQAMMGGSTKAPVACVAWPTGEFGGMGLEGAVRLGYRNELAAIDDPDERERTFQQMVDRMYEVGKAVNVASHFEIDDVIDPADTRRWISALLAAAPVPTPRPGKKRPNIDTW